MHFCRPIALDETDNIPPGVPGASMRCKSVLVARALVDGRPRFGEVDGNYFHVFAGDDWTIARRSGSRLAVDDLIFLSPVDPGKILVQMGGFLKDGTTLPPGTVPWLLPKLASAVSGDKGEIVVPPSIDIACAEVELAIVIGKDIHGASLDEARAAIFGFTCFNDVSAPQFLAAHDVLRAKSIDTFASMGPWIRTDLSDEQIQAGLALTCRINGVTQAEGNTRKMKFAVGEIVLHASTLMTLHPGDVLSLGTPKACEVVPGDLVELEIEGIGVLHNRVVAPA